MTGDASTPTREDRLRVLVIEDYPDGRETLRVLLQLLGHRVEVASTGEDGIRKGLNLHPHLAFVDIGLPGKDGFEVAHALRESLGQSVFLVAHTGYDFPDYRERAFIAGFDRFLGKPLDPDQLGSLLLEARRRAMAPPAPLA